MALTQVSSLNLTKVALEQLAYFALRPELYYDSLCEIKPTNLTNRGAQVTFYFASEMAPAITPLTEIGDVTPVALADSQVSVTCQEYGNAVQSTAKLRATNYIEVNPIIGNVLGYNAGVSVDTLAQAAAGSGTNVLYAAGATRVGLAAANIATAALFRQAVAKLRGANVGTYNGMYKAIIHPDVSYDLRSSANLTDWAAPHAYTDPTGIYNGTVGSFGGAMFMESPRAPLFVDAGTPATVDVYRTLFFGKQALAKAYSNGGGYGEQAVLVDSPQIDILRRFETTGWKHFVGYAPFRQAALFGVESSSSIGTN